MLARKAEQRDFMSDPVYRVEKDQRGQLQLVHLGDASLAHSQDDDVTDPLAVGPMMTDWESESATSSDVSSDWDEEEEDGCPSIDNAEPLWFLSSGSTALQLLRNWPARGLRSTLDTFLFLCWGVCRGGRLVAHIQHSHHGKVQQHPLPQHTCLIKLEALGRGVAIVQILEAASRCLFSDGRWPSHRCHPNYSEIRYILGEGRAEADRKLGSVGKPDTAAGFRFRRTKPDGAVAARPCTHAT